MDLKQAREVPDNEIRALWRSNGGSFHGPHVETGTMPEALLLPWLRSLLEKVEQREVTQLRAEVDRLTAERNDLVRERGLSTPRMLP